jgi:hypothetical protein
VILLTRKGEAEASPEVFTLIHFYCRANGLTKEEREAQGALQQCYYKRNRGGLQERKKKIRDFSGEKYKVCCPQGKLT